MKTAVAVVASVVLAGQVSGSKGSVDHVSTVLESRKLVESPHGLAIADEYIASVAGQNCDTVRAQIEAFDDQLFEQRRRLGMGTNRKKNKKVSSAGIGNDCFIFFEGDADTVEFVEQLEFVIGIEQDLVIQTLAGPPSWGLDRIDQSSNKLDNRPFSASHTGKGAHVYVIDTGINQEHVEFALPGGESRAVFGEEFASDGYQEDGNGHGSHCAGTAAGSTYGIARDATVVGVKVLSASGSGSTSGVINGVSWAVSNAKKVANNKAAVLSLSLGGGKSTSMNKAVNDAANAGMIVVVAAGNDNSNACNYSPASAGGNARNGGVITVGSTTKSDTRSSFSNYGACVDIFAPGSSIKSAWKGAVDASNTISGTSMATPHVAGVAAILLEKHNFDRDAAQAELLAIASTGLISDIKEDSADLFLQVPTYTGPPTMPTPQPTLPPTFPEPTVCMGSKCIDFAMSSFGPGLERGKTIAGPLFATGSDEYLCEKPYQFKPNEMKGKVVLVPRGSASGNTCLFYDKVKAAEDAGALAVLIHLTKASDVIFPPAYYGDGEVNIPSMMVGYKDAKAFEAMQGDYIAMGSGEISPTPAPEPTPEPTQQPTVYVPCNTLKKSACQKRSDCASYLPKGTKKSVCVHLDNTPAPTTPIEVWTPHGCPKGTLEEAENLCSSLDMQLCNTEDLRYGTETNLLNKCKATKKNVWTKDVCTKNRQGTFNGRKSKSGCSKTTNSKVHIRCCV
mmetsp:Transcript_3184/g.6040  ORF Transcript_3184/g.6040 Transcript_3184/m.6040 type:complete len:733 (-) Transcript_3184:110-2308(-)